MRITTSDHSQLYVFTHSTVVVNAILFVVKMVYIIISPEQASYFSGVGFVVSHVLDTDQFDLIITEDDVATNSTQDSRVHDEPLISDALYERIQDTELILSDFEQNQIVKCDTPPPSDRTCVSSTSNQIDLGGSDPIQLGGCKFLLTSTYGWVDVSDPNRPTGGLEGGIDSCLLKETNPFKPPRKKPKRAVGQRCVETPPNPPKKSSKSKVKRPSRVPFWIPD